MSMLDNKKGDDAAFDQFFKDRMDAMEINSNLADQYFSQLKLPASIDEDREEQRHRTKWWLFFFSFFSLAILLFLVTKRSDSNKSKADVSVSHSVQKKKMPEPEINYMDRHSKSGTPAHLQGSTLLNKTSARNTSVTSAYNKQIDTNIQASHPFSDHIALQAKEKATAARSLIVQGDSVASASAGKLAKADSAQIMRGNRTTNDKKADSVFIIW